MLEQCGNRPRPWSFGHWEIAMAVTAGTQLGVYTILDSLGAGGMGEVYRARDGRLDREVAIKFLHEDVTDDPDRLARFEREAKLLASVNHPNIATVYSLDEADGLRFLVMELVPGETLADQLAAGPLPPATVLSIGRQIADALEAAHEQGVVHRDLKPANVKITPRGRVKVLDFGLAKNVGPAASQLSRPPSKPPSDATPAGVLLGTPAYMSPEQARGQLVDRRADVWAFGCVLYEALTGRKPFDGPTITDILVAVLEREPDWDALPAELPPRIRDLLQRCLRKDSGRRLRDIGDARIELEEASPGAELSGMTAATVMPTARAPAAASLSTAPTVAPSTSATMPGEIPANAPSRKGVMIAIAAALAGVLLAGGALGLWLGGVFTPRQEKPPVPSPDNPSEINFQIGPNGIRIDGMPVGPDNKVGGVRLGFSDLMGGFMGNSSKEDRADSLAILPNGGTDFDHLADQIASRINARLVGTPGLKVKAHAEAVRQKNLAPHPKEAGRFLEVNKVLVIWANLEKLGPVVVTADLVNASDGTQLWRHRYENWRSEDELARMIAEQVKQKLVEAHRR
jgi:serine/threonine protein kinase/TolB-like protein